MAHQQPCRSTRVGVGESILVSVSERKSEYIQRLCPIRRERKRCHGQALPPSLPLSPCLKLGCLNVSKTEARRRRKRGGKGEDARGAEREERKGEGERGPA